MKSIQDSRKLLKALGNLSNVTNDVEEHFTDELHVFFQYLGRKIVSNVDLDQPLDAIFYQQVDSVIDDYWKEYEEILSTYVDKAYQVGIVHSKLLLSASKDYAKRYESLKSEDKELFFKPNAKVSKRLKTYKFEASEHTKSRVTDEINNTLGEAYREGWGRENVTKRIQQKFTALATWESRRIAVTEVNSARNLAHYNQLIEDNIAYQKWIPSKDEKVRDSHKMHPIGVGGEIVPVGERFSNGLLHPGDKEGGPIKEWVNCRCTSVAFIIPLGYEAPSFWPFFEEDLVKVGSTDPKDYLKPTEVPPILEDVVEVPAFDSDKLNSEVLRQLDVFEEQSKHWDREKHIILSRDGKLLYTSPFGPKNTMETEIDMDLVEELFEQYGPLHMGHNHPGDINGEIPTCFSPEDLIGLIQNQKKEIWMGDHWEVEVKFYFKSETAQCPNGSRMTLTLNDNFSTKDIPQYHKAIDTLQESYDNWLSFEKDYFNKHFDEYYEDFGYPPEELMNSWRNEAKLKKPSFEEMIQPSKKEFEKANTTLEVRGVK